MGDQDEFTIDYSTPSPWVKLADRTPPYGEMVLYAVPGEKRQHWVLSLGALEFSNVNGHHFSGSLTGHNLFVEYWRPLQPLMAGLK